MKISVYIDDSHVWHDETRIILCIIFNKAMEKRQEKMMFTRSRSNILQRFGKKIKDLFRLEEVEVTFTNDRKAGYTYTRVSNK